MRRSESNETLKEHEAMVVLQNENLTLRVDPLGAQMMELCSQNGTQFLWGGDPAYWCDRAPVLFPYVARLTNGSYTLYGVRYSMDIHGFAKDSVFTVEEQSDDSVTLCLHDSPETLRQYPFHFTFRVRYVLRGWTVAVTYCVQNEDEREMIFGIGGHPGFRVPLTEGTRFEDYELHFSQPCRPDRVGFTEACFLNGQDQPYPLGDGTTLCLRHDLFDEDAIVLKNMARCVTLCSAKSNRAVTVDYPQMPYLGIWHMPRTDAPCVCIEPWASLPSRQDVVEELSCKSDLIHLASGAQYRNTWTITVTEE